MPNWCDNNLTIYGSKEKLQEIRDVIQEYADWVNDGHPKDCKGKYPKRDGTPMGFLYYCKPEPDYNVTPVAKTYPEIGAKYAETEEEREELLKNEPTIRNDSWWDWRIQNWGTKWEITFDWVDEDGDDEVITLSFPSAWSPPVEAYKALLNHEGITGVDATYYEMGCSFAGKFENGEDTCLDTTALTKEDFEKNETIWELDDCFNIESDIMQNNPTQLRPELQPVLDGLGIENCWHVDWKIVVKIYDILKEKTITPESITVKRDDNNCPTHFVFQDKEYKL